MTEDAFTQRWYYCWKSSSAGFNQYRVDTVFGENMDISN